jgi:hypothetical protein
MCQPSQPPSEGSVRRTLILGVLTLVTLCPGGARAQAQVPKALAAETDLDRFMATALLRRDVDRKTLSDYVLDEVEMFEVLGPGKVPFARMRREYTWYVRDGIHVRSPLKFDGVPIPEADRRAYEEKWIHSEENRRKFRTERDAKRAEAGKPPAVSVPSVNEPRFISESYFMDFKFEPGNYYLAGKETIDGHEVLKIDYLPTKLFNEDDDHSEDEHNADKPKDDKKPDDKKADDSKAEGKKVEKEKPDKRTEKQKEKDQKFEEDIDHKMNKTSQVTLWVEPSSHQIVKYTFDNVWMDFLPAGWLVHIDDLRASMQMGQPFPGVWLPNNVGIHAGVSLALGPMELTYKREFSNYRKADVSSKITIPKKLVP